MLGGYAALVGLRLLGGWLFSASRARRIVVFAGIGTGVAAGLDVVENALLRRGLDAIESGTYSAL